MDDRILEVLLARTPDNTLKASIKALMGMRCRPSDPMPLDESALLETLELPGEYFILQARYADLEQELKTQKIKRKISEATAVVTVYEEDGASLPSIENFVRYIHGVSDPLQRSIFGIRRVDRLSDLPVTILFGGILPINQLRMRLGRDLDRLIRSDADYFVPRFAELRRRLSKAIGVPILPLYPEVDDAIPPNRAELYDPLDGAVICRFDVENPHSKEGLERYLARLYHVYQALGIQMRKQLDAA